MRCDASEVLRTGGQTRDRERSRAIGAGVIAPFAEGQAPGIDGSILDVEALAPRRRCAAMSEP
jgi:hypothetical protein